MSTRVRFAPSPTGHVHIGNIRTAIFNWLFARATDGAFLLRIEDTDRERSTDEAINTLMDVMKWMDLDVDEDPLYQTSQRAVHDAAAEKLLASGDAYRFAKGEGGEATLFRIPFHCDALPFVRDAGPIEIAVHPDVPVEIDHTGIRFAMVSKKGKAVPTDACLAGFQHLTIHNATDGDPLWHLDDPDAILNGDETVSIPGATLLKFRRREVFYQDVVKGEIAKPLDSMKDQVIVRSDGNPVFHLANVCDDVTQGITHIIRGDDHVENTFRHIFLFDALGAEPPKYAHLPMIVNAQGKPYSKRDGDAFVHDFREKGVNAHALTNYLALLGWSPGDDREKMTSAELVDAFTLDRVRSSPSQMDMRKLEDLNGQYVSELAPETFLDAMKSAAAETALAEFADSATFADVAKLMQSRTKLLSADVLADWTTFFVAPDEPDRSIKAVRKAFNVPGVAGALESLADSLSELDAWTETAIEPLIPAAAESAEIPPNKFNLPVRLSATGRPSGADILPTLVLIGQEEVCNRLRRAATEWIPSA